MRTHLRARLLALAVLAVIVTSAVSASAALAGTFTAGAYPSTVKGVSASHLILTKLGLIQCGGPSFEGELAAAGSLTLTPNYGTSCKLGLSTEIHVSNNGCSFRLNVGGEYLEKDLWEGTMDILCPLGNAIDFEITSSPICHMTLPAQEGLAGPSGGPGLNLRNQTSVQRVDVTFNLSKVLYMLDSGCSSTGTFEGGYSAGTSLNAYHEGVQTSLLVE